MKNLKGKVAVSTLILLAITTLFMVTAFAGATISGSSTVVAGKTYTYSIKVTATGSSIMGTATSSGFSSGSTTWSDDSSLGLNESLSASTSLTVTVPSNAAIGATCTISVSGQGSSFDGGIVSKFNISGSKTITVGNPPAPKATATPHPPTAWETAMKKIEGVQEGGSIIIKMNPEKSSEINVPNEVLVLIKSRNVTLGIDYGSFVCTLMGEDISSTVDSKESTNLGITKVESKRADNMMVFSLNNASRLDYKATYSFKPTQAIPEGLIYVYRYYEELEIFEYVNVGKIDGNGNILIEVFAPGKYVISSSSIDGAIGNMDEETFIELFTTPEPTVSPIPEPILVPEATSDNISEMVSNRAKTLPIVWVLMSVLILLLVGLSTVVIINIKNKINRKKN